MENLKQLLLQCEIYIQEGDWDKLIEALNSIGQEHINNLDYQTAYECYRILEHLIAEGEKARNRLAEAMVNIKKFKESYGA